MSMQKRIYEVGAVVDGLYNDTVVDLSLQAEAYWQRLRERMPIKTGKKVVDNVVYADFSPQEKIAEIIPSVPSIELAKES